MVQFQCLFGALFLCWLLVLSLAELQTVTVDDTNGDEMSKAKPTYFPDGDWALGQECKGCSAQPDPSLAFNGTWHDTTHSKGHLDQRSVTVQFGGTAVSVYFITANNLGQVTTVTNLTFTIDGDLVGNFLHEPSPDADYKYNVLGYSNSSLENTFHNLVISTTGNASLMLFDYLTYTFDTAHIPVYTFSSFGPLPTLSIPAGSSQSATPSPSLQSSTSRSISTGLIIGIVLASLISIISALVLFLCRRRRRLQRDASRWKMDESVLSSTLVASLQNTATIRGRQYHFGGIPGASEKGSRMQMDEIQARIEILRMRVAQVDALERSPGTYTSLRPSESASRIVAPRMRSQIVELQTQITTLEEERRRALEQITQ